ncbi:MAG TPA: translocation/assembly module TamB domain-containing protein [Candidatus Aquilonibacter sp.]|nr:translocation/assembly module TamB domain-containing protein [Candidatus Aquilonibacter sp.]
MRWQRSVGWTFAVILALLAVVGIGGYLFVKSSAFNQFARRKIAEATLQATGARTTIGGLEFSIPSLTAHLYNITVRGKEEPNQPPLLTIDEITVGLKIQSLIHHKISLNQLIIERPVAHLEVNRAGESNLPVAPAHSGSQVNVFELAVQHAQLTQGDITYNDRKIPVAADVYDLSAEIHFDQPALRYIGYIAYDNGQLRYGDYAPLPHSLEAKFNATPSRLSIESAKLRIGHSEASVQASLSDYSDPVVEANYNVNVDAHDFSSVAPAYSPAGDLSLAGRVHYHGIADESLLRNLHVDGEVASESLSATSAGQKILVSKLRGSFQLQNGALQANAIRFNTLGGWVNADINIRDLADAGSGQAHAALHNISLQGVQRTLRAETKQVAVTGNVNGTAVALWSGSIRNVRIRSDLDVSAEAKNRTGSGANPSASQIPVNGMIHATYDGASNAVVLNRSMLRIPSATLTAEGELSKKSDLRVQANVTDLKQLETLAGTFRRNSAALPPVSGSATLNATLTGSLATPRIEGQVSAQNLNFQGSAWRSAHADFQARPSRVAITDATLVSAQKGRASFSGAVVLRDWHYSANNSLTANLSLQHMSIADLQRSGNLHYPVSGDLSANVVLNGTELNPQGSGKVQVTNALVYEQPVQMLTAQFHAVHGTVISSLHVATPAGIADGNLSYTPASKAYIVRFDAPSMLLQKLQAVQAKNLRLNGSVTVSASGQGTLDNPRLNASFRLVRVTVQGKSISHIEANLQVANHKADLLLNSKVLDASVQARAQVDLTGNYYTEASIDTTTVPLGVLLDTFKTNVPAGFTGQTELHATLKGPLKDAAQLEAHITIPTLNASYQSLQIGIASPVHAEFANSVLTLQPAEIRGTDTSLRLQGSIPFSGSSVPNLTADGSLNVGIVKIFSPETRSSGTISFNLHASGSARDPNVNGQIVLHDVAMLYSGAPTGVSNLNGTLDIAKDSIQISKVTGQVGGGDIVAGGSIIYRPKLQFNLLLQGQAIRLLYPAGLRTSLDTNLSFTGNEQASRITGRVLIDSLGFTPDFDLSTFTNQFNGGTSLPTQPGLADNIKLDVSVQSKDNLAANSSQVSVEGGVNVRIIGTAADPVVIGRTDLTSGEVFYRNVRYQIQQGIITFDNPTQTNPVVNISATTTVEQYNLTLKLSGPFDKLTTSYTSDPPLATADIINLLAQGQTTEESAAAGQSTDSMIASQAAGQFVGGIQKLAGISSLEIDPLIGGGNQNASARIAVQQRVTKNLLFTFSTDVSQPGSEVVEGDYQINKRWSVNVTRDQVGGVSVGGELHTKF